MGRKDRERQDAMWIAASEIARTEGQVFCRELNRLFGHHDCHFGIREARTMNRFGARPMKPNG